MPAPLEGSDLTIVNEQDQITAHFDESGELVFITYHPYFSSNSPPVHVPVDVIRFNAIDQSMTACRLVLYTRKELSFSEPKPPRGRPGHFATIELDGDKGHASIGGHQVDGFVEILNAETEPLVRLAEPNVFGNIRAGNLSLYRSHRSPGQDPEMKASVTIDAGEASLGLGGYGSAGHIHLFRSEARARDAASATVDIDGENANLGLGGDGADGDLRIRNRDGAETVRIDGDSGDIRLRNADCAEEFEVADPRATAPGTVCVVADDGRLVPCAEPYNTRVVGVVSGAGDFRPGIVLDKRPEGGGQRAPVALMGKVCCKVDATTEPVGVGDLLTSSSTPGYAKKVTNRGRAVGAILGKALEPLPEGRGLIQILVTLQ